MTESASTPRLRASFAIYLALIIATAFVGPRQVGSATYNVTGMVGFTCVALACLGRIWCSLFIAGHKDVTLITRGPYVACRHPLYSLSLLGALGLGLTTRSWLLCAIMVALIFLLVFIAAAREERFLAGAFPAEFRAYVIATPNRFWPSLSRAPLPQRIEVHPAVFWKSLIDAGSFFLLWLLVAVATEYRLNATLM
jgi:protein-S-isoprenylcysteine O-methyltransferase Ste14